MPSNGKSESHDQGKRSASGRGQDGLYATYPSTPAEISVPHPRLANQGSHVHGTWMSPPKEPYRHEALCTLGQQRTRSPEPSGSDRRVERSSSYAPGIAQGLGSNYPGFIGAAGGRRNAICSEAIKEYLATHHPSEAWETDDEDADYEIVKRNSPSTTAGQRTATAAMQRSPSSTVERSPARPSPTGAASGTAMTRVLQSTANASVADDETAHIGAFWNDQGARKRGRYG